MHNILLEIIYILKQVDILISKNRVVQTGPVQYVTKGHIAMHTILFLVKKRLYSL